MRLSFDSRKHLLSLLILIQVVSTISFASGPQCQDLFSNKPAITPTQHLENNKFNIRRSLEQYSDIFSRPDSKEFEKIILGLGAGSVWIDMGAGEANALSGGLNLNPDLTAVAISYKKPETAANLERFGNRASYIDGDMVENLYLGGKLNSYKGKTSLITDLFGPLTYTQRIDIVLEAYLGLLKKDGELYFNLMTEAFYSAHETHKGVELDHNKVEVSGTKMELIEWIKTIQGIKVIQLHQKFVGNIGATREISRAYKIIKVSEEVVVPKNLNLSIYDDGIAPPVRRFTVHP